MRSAFGEQTMAMPTSTSFSARPAFLAPRSISSLRVFTYSVERHAFISTPSATSPAYSSARGPVAPR